MRTFTSVYTSVNSQSRALNECFTAPAENTHEWPVKLVACLGWIDSPFVGMDPKVASEVTLASEGSVAVVKLADKGPHEKIVARSDLIGVVDKLKL